MRIVQLTPGAGGMFCGGCMRDNALVAALRKMGHDALLLPLYMPLTTDEPDNSQRQIFFGGLNVYLQQKLKLFRRTPRWLDKLLDSRSLLNFAAKFAVKTSPQELGDLTLSMLRGEEGKQAKELDKLLDFFSTQPKPEIVVLSNALLIGMARRLHEELKVPVVSTLQGEDFFLDGLPERVRDESWGVLRERAKDVDGFIAVSRYYAGVMQNRLSIPVEKMHVVLNGINLDGYTPAQTTPSQPTIGFLARMAPEKGLRTLLAAFQILVNRGNVPLARLKIGGSLTAMDAKFVAEIKRDVTHAKLAERVSFHPNLERAQKIEFLQSLSVLSVPAVYGEAFGLFVIEALACGVPVVQPDHGGFSEILQKTGGGLLCKPGDAVDLAAKLERLLLDESLRSALGAGGRGRVLEEFSIERMTQDALCAYDSIKNRRGAESQRTATA
jgi:glycosyltransferase involved in cell wall biosynthesis